MSAHTCPYCNSTGELDGSGSLDCVHCDAATERAAMNEFIKREGQHMTSYDLHWMIHLRAVKLAQESVK